MKRKIENPAQERLYGDSDFGYGGPVVTNDRASALEFKEKFQDYVVYFEEGKKKFEVVLNDGKIEVNEVQEFDFSNPVDKLIYGEDYKK